MHLGFHIYDLAFDPNVEAARPWFMRPHSFWCRDHIA